MDDCILVQTEWADGDSFLVQTKSGEKYTVRLYGADCMEHHVTDESDARRLRSQRRYFGISEHGGGPKSSIAKAKDLGSEATKETRRILSSPFTLQTAFSDARGDGKYKRIYGFIDTSSGEDLAEHLVSIGLARAFGVCRLTPGGESGASYREGLQDLELRAAKLGLGAWEYTDWEKFTQERNDERKEEREIEMATGAKGEYSGQVLNVNSAARDELMLLPGIGETMANRIIEGRPYRKLEDLDDVDGIGKATLESLQPFLLFNAEPVK